jgi:hypothetical protein
MVMVINAEDLDEVAELIHLFMEMLTEVEE